MADKITVNVRPFVGEYELDLDGQQLNVLEWRWIKKISGYLPLTINDGLAGGDPDLFLALAVVAIVRSGKADKTEALSVAEQLELAPVDGTSIAFAFDADREDDALPPPPTELRPRSSGGSGSQTLGSSDDTLIATGVPV